MAEVNGVEPERAWVTMTTVDGQRITVDRMVLAVGHYPPAHPSGFSPDFLASPYYVRDPWVRGALDSLLSTAPVLLIGTGLTTLDVALDLHARGIPGSIAVSRARALAAHARSRGAAARSGPPPARFGWDSDLNWLCARFVDTFVRWRRMVTGGR